MLSYWAGKELKRDDGATFARRLSQRDAATVRTITSSGETTLKRTAKEKATQAPTEIFIPEVVQYPDGFLVELSDGDYTLERAPDSVGGYCVLRYTPGPPGYVSIVVVKRAGADADDPSGRSCCVQSSADDALLPSKPSSETLLEM